MNKLIPFLLLFTFIFKANSQNSHKFISKDTLSRDLEEVVVIGYGRVKKSDLTGSTIQIKGEELQKIPTGNALQALQGKAAGVQIINSGKPGDSPTIRIRGVSTALAGTSTLFVVDGILTDDISNLNINDIKSIDILKDASSTAIYGARGANGVIIINTKTGEGELKISCSSNVGLRNASYIVPMANSSEYLNYISSLSVNTNNFPSNNTNWFKEILRIGKNTSKQFSISNGNEKFKNLFSIGYFSDQGIIIQSQYSRLNFRLNQSYKPHKNLNLGWNISYSPTNSKEINLASAYNNAYRASPLVASKIDGLYGNTSLFQNVGNPILDLDLNNSKTTENRLQANGFANLQFTKFFNFKISYGIDQNNSYNKTYVKAFSNDQTVFLDAGGNQRNPLSNLSYYFGNYRHTTLDNILNFDHKIHDLSINWIFGNTLESHFSNSFYLARRQVPNAINLQYIDLGNPNTSTNAGNGDKWNRISFLSRIQLNQSEKYLLALSGRIDGSSRLPQQNRFGKFYSTGIGWVISEEDFMQDLSFIQFLKFKSSYAIVGNDRIPTDGFSVTVDPNLPYFFGGNTQIGSAISQIKDPNLKWETTIEKNIGLEFSLLNGKIQGEMVYYDKKAKDLLINVKVPSVVGDKDAQVLTNAASIQNKGLEISLSYQNVLGNQWNYKISTNNTLNKNQVVGLNGGQPILDGGIGAGQFFTTKTDNGQAVGSFYLLKVLGVFQSSDQIHDYKNSTGKTIQPNAVPGDFIYQDTNGDGTIDDLDRVYLGSYQPKIYSNLSFSIQHSRWSLSMDLLSNVGGKIYNGKKAFRQGLLDNIEKTTAFGRWYPGSNINDEPASNAGYLPASSYFLESGDFIRLNNLSLQYSFGVKELIPFGIKYLKIYLSGQNLFTYKKFSGFNVELPSNSPTNSGIELNAYPIPKSLNIGLNLEL